VTAAVGIVMAPAERGGSVRGPCTGAIVAALAAALAALAAWCGSAPPPGPGAGAPASAAGTLAWTRGDWTGTRRNAADGTEAPMTVRVVPILGGAGQTEQIEVRGAKGTYHGFGTEVFDGQLGRWVMMYANAVHGRFARYEGTAEGAGGTAEGARVDWWSTTAEAPHRSRLVWERPKADRWRRTMSVSDDDGKTWRVLWNDELVAAARR